MPPKAFRDGPELEKLLERQREEIRQFHAGAAVPPTQRVRSPAPGGGVGSGHAPTAAGSRRQPRPDDWTCAECGFQPNFGNRLACFTCGAPRLGSTATRRPPQADTCPTYRVPRDGPVGAGGSRPMLQTWAARMRQQTGLTPTAANRAKSPSGGPADPVPPRTTTAVPPAPPRARPVVGEDGFTSVPPRGRARQPTRDEEPLEAADSDVESVDDVSMGSQCSTEDYAEAHGADRGDDRAQDVASDPATVADLRKAYDGHRKRLQDAEASTEFPYPPAALAALREAAEQAHADWQRARKPPPLERLHQRAGASLKRAERAKQAKLDQLQAFEAWCKSERENRMDEIQQASDRVRRCQAKLDDVIRRIADTRPNLGGRQAPRDLTQAKSACGALESHVTPALLRIIEQVPEGCRDALRGCVADLQSVSVALSTAFLEQGATARVGGQSQPQQFSMGCEDSLPSLSSNETCPEPADRSSPMDVGDAAKRVADAADSSQPPARRARRRFQSAASPSAPTPVEPEGDPAHCVAAEAAAAAADEAARRVKEENAAERRRELAQHEADQQHAIRERQRVAELARNIVRQATENGLRTPADISEFTEEQLKEYSRAFLA